MEGMIKCPACGANNSKGSWFCTSCGALFDNVEPVPLSKSVIPETPLSSSSQTSGVTSSIQSQTLDAMPNMSSQNPLPETESVNATDTTDPVSTVTPDDFETNRILQQVQEDSLAVEEHTSSSQSANDDIEKNRHGFSSLGSATTTPKTQATGSKMSSKKMLILVLVVIAAIVLIAVISSIVRQSQNNVQSLNYSNQNDYTSSIGNKTADASIDSNGDSRITNSGSAAELLDDNGSESLRDLSGLLSVGDHAVFGTWDEQLIEWRVLAIRDQGALVITQNILTNLPYNNEDNNISWADCTLRSWLNDEFLTKAFSENEQNKILLENVSNPDNPASGADGGVDTQDKVFLLSIDEVEQYFNNDGDRVTSNAKIGEGPWWYLRSPGLTINGAALVIDGGVIYGNGISVDLPSGVRPAMWVAL